MYHLAQLNIAHLKYPIDHPQISEFVDNLDKINALAENSSGFVWRLTEETESNYDMQFFGDPMVLANMSVWESIENLRSFAYHSVHADIMKNRNQWFEKPSRSHLVLWWIKANHTPTLSEAEERLQHLSSEGASPFAFDFTKLFDSKVQ